MRDFPQPSFGSFQMDPTKRELREQKRQLKRAGSRHRRRDLKASLRQNPEDAHEDKQNFGRYSTAELNGLDQDATRKRLNLGSARSSVGSESPDADGSETEHEHD